MDYQTLFNKTVAELKQLARTEQVRLPSGVKKTDIIQILLDYDAVKQQQAAARMPEIKKAAAPEDKPEGCCAQTAAESQNGQPAAEPVRGRTLSTQQRMGARTQNAAPQSSAQRAEQRLPAQRANQRTVRNTRGSAQRVQEAESARETAGITAAAPAEAGLTAAGTALVPDRGRPEAVQGNINPAVPGLIASGECSEGAGILEIHPDGYGFLRTENYLPGNRDIYVSSTQIRRFNLRTGDHVAGKTRAQQTGEQGRSVGLIYISEVNGQKPDAARGRRPFDSLVPVYPNRRLRMEHAGESDTTLRLIDLLAPIGKGQRGMIVSQPKAGKTTLLKKIANAIAVNNPEAHLIVLLIDERPEEVAEMKRDIQGEVVFSTFDEAPENYTRVSEMVLERAQRLVEMGKDVVILLDSITRLARAYNLVIPPTGRSLSGGLDPGALYKPKRFFGAARNIENGGSLTIIATALVDTGSRMDDIIFEEFKGTGNMEIHLDRSLSDRRIFPAIDMFRSGTRREELLLDEKELDCAYRVRRMLSRGSAQETAEYLIMTMMKSPTMEDFYQRIRDYGQAYKKDGFTMK